MQQAGVIGVDSLRRLARYNTWANGRVWRIVGDVAPSLLDQRSGGTFGSVNSTLKHLVLVEDRFLAAARGRDPMEELGPPDAYLAHQLPWFADRLAVVGQSYQELLAAADDAFLAAALAGGRWVGLDKRDGLLQVFTHSAHHRAHVLSALGEHGLQVPDIDYLIMLREIREAAAPPA
jgi:uncharacterized damage-inducible protein DinB